MQRKAASRLSPPCRQRGAVLVVGLVLLLVLTVIGISGVNTAAMEIAMASSTQAREDAFQLAEDAIDIALATQSYATAAPTIVAALGVPGFDRHAVVTFTGITTPVPGEANSQGVAGAMAAWHFEAAAQGEGPRNAAASHTQGFYVRGRSE